MMFKKLVLMLVAGVGFATAYPLVIDRITKKATEPVGVSVTTEHQIEPVYEEPEIVPSIDLEVTPNAIPLEAGNTVITGSTRTELDTIQQQIFEQEFSDQYLAPANCGNWASQEVMIDCINHQMKAKAEFRKIWQAPSK